MPWSLEGERHDEPEWEPNKSGPEYHLNKQALPRCLRCSMPCAFEFDAADVLYLVCGNARCRYREVV